MTRRWRGGWGRGAGPAAALVGRDPGRAGGGCAAGRVGVAAGVRHFAGRAGKNKERALACRMATTWTSPSVGQCRSGPAPVDRSGNPATPLESPLPAEQDQVVSREKPPRLSRGSLPADSTFSPAEAADFWSPAANSGLVGCLSSVQRRLRLGYSPLTDAQQIPDKPRHPWCPRIAVGLLPDRPGAALTLPGPCSGSRGEPSRLNGASAWCARRAAPESVAVGCSMLGSAMVLSLVLYLDPLPWRSPPP